VGGQPVEQGGAQQHLRRFQHQHADIFYRESDLVLLRYNKLVVLNPQSRGV
jgi:hypothetical protein